MHILLLIKANIGKNKTPVLFLKISNLFTYLWDIFLSLFSFLNITQIFLLKDTYPKAEYCKICDVRRRTDTWAAEQFCSNVGEKKIVKVRISRTRLHYVLCNATVQWKTTRSLSWGKIESFFGHFTKFNCRKTDTSQNSIAEKRTLHKIHYQKNGHFTKFNI